MKKLLYLILCLEFSQFCCFDPDENDYPDPCDKGTFVTDEINAGFLLWSKNGDELFVPRNTVQVKVMGTGVKSPGEYRVAPGTTLLEVISTAGGLEDRAILRECAVVRFEPTPGRIPADIERLVKQGDMSQNPVLRDRDIVYVPGREPAQAGGRKSTLSTMAETAMRYWWLWL